MKSAPASIAVPVAGADAPVPESILQLVQPGSEGEETVTSALVGGLSIEERLRAMLVDSPG